MENENLKLWRRVEKTNPAYTKNAKLNGNDITAIEPQYQIMNVTEQFGIYGVTWGFKNIEFDYSLTKIPHKVDVLEGKYPNQTKIGEKETILGLVVFKATFFFPNGEFPITNSIKIFLDNMHTKIDDNFAKKVETDTLTKAISKLGFNADIFLGKFDDKRYVEEVKNEFQQEENKRIEEENKKKTDAYIESVSKAISEVKNKSELTKVWKSIPENWQQVFTDAVKNKKTELESNNQNQ